MEKSALRQFNKSRLADLSPETMALFDAQIASYFLTSQSFMPQSIIACYMPLKGEVSCKPLIQTLSGKGHITCLPVVLERNSPMVFRQYKPGDEMVRGKLGAFEPLPDAREVIPDVLIIPMLGFNRGGNRLGYGTGLYDRTLPLLRTNKSIKAIGLAYSVQESPELPVESHDTLLNTIITEKEIIEIK